MAAGLQACRRAILLRAWGVPRSPHTYLVDEVLAPDVLNLYASLLHRFTTFFKGLLTSPNQEVSVVALMPPQRLAEQPGHQPGEGEEHGRAGPLDHGGQEQLRSALDKVVKREVPEQDSWRPVCLQKLLAFKMEAHFMADQEEVARL